MQLGADVLWRYKCIDWVDVVCVGGWVGRQTYLQVRVVVPHCGRVGLQQHFERVVVVGGLDVIYGVATAAPFSR